MGMKTLIIGVAIGVIGNLLTDAGGYFAGKLIKVVAPVLTTTRNKEGKDAGEHKATYQLYKTSKKLLENVLEGDAASRRVEQAFDDVFLFAKEESIPCDCVPLLTLLALQKLDISIIVDDSTSMGTGKGSNWEECKKSIKMIARFGLISENSSISVRFLNQTGITKIVNDDTIDALFARSPVGSTPLIKTLEATIAEIKKLHENKRHLLYVFTDGIPTDGAYYQPILTWVRDVFSPDRESSDNLAINFIVEGKNLSTEKEYKKVDDFTPQDGRILHIDTNFSYEIEKNKCLDIDLTEGLYKMKVLVGAINEEFDDLDVSSLSLSGHGLQGLKDAWGTLRELNMELLTEQENGM